jgi:hypothetical protein
MIEEIKIYRVATTNIKNNWNEVVHYKGTILHCTEDLGSFFLAKVPCSTDIPRILPKNECRRLTDEEWKKI